MGVSQHTPSSFDWLAHHAGLRGGALAAVDFATDRSWTYQALHERVSRLAEGLAREYKVQPGDRLTILAKNSIDFFEFMFACWRLGAIFTPLNWRLSPPELAKVLAHAAPKVVAFDESFENLLDSCQLPLLRRVPGKTSSAYETLIAQSKPFEKELERQPGDVHSILYTSGTTGPPKGVLYTHEMTNHIIYHAESHALLDEQSRVLTFAPLFHAAPLYAGAVPSFYCGGTVYVMDHWDAAACLDYISDASLGITHFNGVPTNFVMMSELPTFAAASFPTIKMFGIGSAPIGRDLLETWAAKGAVLTQSYGMTEAFSVTLTSLEHDDARAQIGTAGRPMSEIDLRLVDEQGKECAKGEVGEVQLRGPGVSPGYYKEPGLTKAAFSADGWFKTGDMARWRGDGCLQVVDRVKDMFISGGENVYPSEVEDVINRLEAVSQVAVIALPHPKWGEVGAALIVVREGHALSEETVEKLCRAELAGYKVPHHIQFREALPLSPQGKVLKRALRKEMGTLE